MEQETQTGVVLSPQQEDAAGAFEKFLDDFNNNRDALIRPFFVIEGYAGTGKSYSVGEMLRRTKLRATYMTYTGKAALVLRKYGGLDARTIHSTIYELVKVGDDVFKNLYEKLEKAGTPEEAKEIKQEIEQLQQPRFVLKENAFEEDETDILVLDECSMVDTDILNDLLSFDLPIIALGDPGQLPPVKGEGALFQGMADAQLTEIRRQALDSPIIKWSMWARQQRPLPTSGPEGWLSEEVCKIPVGMVREAQQLRMMEEHDVVICWKNKTRMMLNQMWRRHKGFYNFDPIYPVPGETLIITKNDKDLGIFNGQFVTLKEIEREFDNYIQCIVLTDEEKEIRINLHRVTFETYHDPDAKDKYRPWDYRNTQQADFGYVITCHKSQGSQWERVMIYEENVFNWPKMYLERAQWLYTAITRAVKKVTILSGKMD
jgi:exodeoxyribonuclease V